MKRKPALTLVFVLGAALVLGLVVGITALANGGAVSGNGAFLAAASASPSPRSNETAAHEKNESAAQEAAENNGTFYPGGPGGPGGHRGPSNETASHEATESAAQEAAETS